MYFCIGVCLQVRPMADNMSFKLLPKGSARLGELSFSRNSVVCPTPGVLLNTHHGVLCHLTNDNLDRGHERPSFVHVALESL